MLAEILHLNENNLFFISFMEYYTKMNFYCIKHWIWLVLFSLKKKNEHLAHYIIFWCCMWIQLMQMQLINWTFLLYCREIFALYSIYVLDIHILYLLRHDGYRSYTFSTPSSCHFFCILLYMEPPFWFSHPETCK